MSDYADRFISAREDGYSATDARRIANGQRPRPVSDEEWDQCSQGNDIELEGDLLRDEGEL